MIEDYEKVKARSLHLLDYLTALAAERTTKPKRALSEYNPPLIRPADVPRHAGVLVGAAAAPSAWLRVRKVEEPPPPTLPAGFDSYLGSTAVLGGTAVDAAAPPTLPPDFDETCARHNKDPAPLRAEFAAWMEQQWEPWAELARPARAARVLYQRLYDLRLQLARDNATHELVWGHGELIWALGGQTIDHPLVITPVAIEMDTDTGVLTLVPDGLPAVETDPLHGLGLAALEELTALRDRVRASPPDPWSAGGLAEVFDQAVAPLGLDARVLAGDPEGDEVPIPAAVRAPAAPAAAAVLIDTWVVFVRPRPALYQRFYSELRQVLAGRDELPEALAAIVTEGNDGRAGDDPADAGRAGRVSWADNLGQRLLMPLASNDEQERIAVQLARARGVTVQGPPGTGKSHTIANLVSHLVAHGQRVLVTAHNEQALSVLRGKIPIELRDLSVAVLGSSSAALGELRTSVQMIMDAVSSIDEGPETAAVEALIAQLDAARAQERHLELRLVSLLADEAAQFPLADGAPLNDGAPLAGGVPPADGAPLNDGARLAGGSAKAADVASWLAAHEARWDRIPDRLRPDQRPGLTTAELDELIRLAALTRDDMRTAQLDLPEPRDLPSAAALSEHFRRLDRLRDDLADLETQGVTLAAVDALGAEAWSRLLADVDTAAHVTAAREPWVATVGEQVAESAALAGFWAEQTNQLGDTARTIIELRRVTFGRAVVVPDGDPRVQQEWLDELADRFAAGRGVPRLGHKDLRAFHAAIRVDDLEPRTVGDIDVVRATIRERVATAAAGRRYEEIVALVGAPPLPVNAPAFLPTLEANVTRLSEAITWETTDRTATVARLSAVLPDTPARPTSAQWTTAATILAGATRRHQERELTAKLDALGTFLDDGAGTPRASPLWGVLRDGLERRDLDTWRSALDEAVRLAALRPALDRRDELARRLAARAPLWTARIIDHGGDPAVCGHPTDLPNLWRWRQAQTWLEDLLGRGDADVLQHQLAATTAQVRQLVLEVAARSARLGMKANLREDQRRALQGWLQALARIGRGTGKFAPKWEAEARAQMPTAMGAVPVWIMPIHRVLQSFDPRTTDLFDVVIVDESSQCDVLSLGVLALGRKVVIVGDDKQISPAAVGVDRDRVFQLIDAHLPGFAQRFLLDVEASLYDTATRVFPDVVLLREHFRCVPDIIGFSNRFYDGRILPLREDADLGIGPAVRPVPVPDGVRTRGQYGDVNEPETRAVVQQIIECCDNPAYDGMTFGVVTLLGNGQGRLIEQSLIGKLGSEEYERRRIRVGDPYNFQGDERDVIFISMVADDNRSAAVKNADRQRINVAASRARDQLWIFHSVDPTVLHPDDVRAHLLAYAYGINTPQAQVTALEERCESDFEKRVLRELLRRGYRIRAQHPVGHFRIDLVVEGDRDRLAVECDGDRFHGPDQWGTDLRRQRVLERQGWKFWRVRGSAYYRHPQEALAPLWERLAELDIQPTRTTDSARYQPDSAGAPGAPRNTDCTDK